MFQSSILWFQVCGEFKYITASFAKLMIRESSQRHIKIKQRQKSRPVSRMSQTKGQPLVGRPAKVQTGHHLQVNQQPKVVKTTSKTKISRNVPQKMMTRHSKNLKNQPDSHALYMKGNLKQLISKNISSKPNNSEVVPQLLKNIEKHCKELKKIHSKEHKVYDKRISLQENKLEKERKGCGGNRSHDFQHKKVKEVHQRQLMKPNNNRLSLQMNSKGVKQEDRDPLTNQRLCKKIVEAAGNDKNFVQLFKIYKKSFQIEDVKIQKSNKNTNYNTNQSKNSSSIFNSAHGDHNARNKLKTEDKLNMNKIQSLIKSQQRSVSKENNQEQKCSQENSNCKVNRFELDQEENYRISASKQGLPEKSNNFNDSLEIREEEIVIMEPIEFKENLAVSRNKGLEVPSKEVTPNKEKSGGRSHEGSYEKEVVEKKFEGSKYYVQPIPCFKAKTVEIEQQEEEEDSLVGCEITLIQNNVICEDSELMSLQL